ncbi:MAG: hypothetical protein ACYCU7_12485 [Acidimicrobiales bacterium]
MTAAPLGGADRVQAAGALGLAPRPAPDPVVVALVAAAVEQLRPVAVGPPAAPDHAAWRFSGRWWHRPVPARRDRPWTTR